MWRMILTVVCCLLLCTVLTRAVGDTGGQAGMISWVNSDVRTLRLLGPAPDATNEPNFQNNLDCDRFTYRLINDSVMQPGCFVQTAFGLMDPDSDLVIFNGTDEALPLKPYTAHQILVPWPNTLNILALMPVNTGGSSIGLYKNIADNLRDERDGLARLNAKQVMAAPDITLTDPSGQPLVVNAQTMAFSANGEWLVAETLNGSFVRINLATLEMTPFAPAFGAQGSPALLKSQVAISENGRYVAIENSAAASFKVYALSTCSGPVEGLRPLDCATFDYWPFVASQLTGLSGISHLRFAGDTLLSFNAASTSGNNAYELSPTASIDSLIQYLALGDSYTSGEGAFDYQTGTDTGSDLCHLSGHSYPIIISAQLFSSGHSVACSGARVQDITPAQPGNYRGQVAGGIPNHDRTPDAIAQLLANFTPGYLAQADFVSHYRPGVVTISVGGDDIGFGNMVQNCVEPHLSLHLSDGTCYDTYEDRLEIKNLVDRTVPKWAALYRQVQSKSPGSRLYVIGYPQIAVDDGNCALNVHLSKSELEFAEEVVSYLDGAIREAAADAGVNYLDISQALAGHRLCESSGYSVAINGLTAGTDGGPLGLKIFGKESYHPNMLGQSLIAAAILKQSQNLTLSVNKDKDSPKGGAENDSQNLLNVPRSNRSVNVLIPEGAMTNHIFSRGQAIILQVSGSDAGLRARSTYIVRVDGANGTILGALTSDQAGDLSGQVNPPEGAVMPGGHTIDVTGVNQLGEPIDVTQPIYVAAGGGDADGDGIPDTADSCPTIPNNGVDFDGDGIDDGCDPLIGPASTNQGSGGPGPTAGSAISSPGTANTIPSPPEPSNNDLSSPTVDEQRVISGQASTDTDFYSETPGLVIATFAEAAKTVAPMRSDTPAVAMLSRSQDTKRPIITPAKGIASFGGLGPSRVVHQVNSACGRQRSCTQLLVIKWLRRIIAAAGLWLMLCLMVAWFARHRRKSNNASYRHYHGGELLGRALVTASELFGPSCTIIAMLWVRKGVVHLLSALLFFALVTWALAISLSLTFGHPAKIESWLAQSNLYSSFVSNAIKQASSSAGSSSNGNGSELGGGISLNDVAVQQAANSAFTPALLQQAVSTFLNSNYAWLQGKTTVPNFSINLSAAKEGFAQQVGQYVEVRLASLPTCTVSQLAEAQQQLNNDPLSLTCRPGQLSPAVEGAIVTKQLETSSDFLSNPVITASSLNPNGGSVEPYYQKLSYAPKVYRLTTKLPWLLGLLAILSAVGIVFVAARKRLGLRRVGIVLLEVGVLLIVVKFAADFAFKKTETKLFNNTSVGPLQQSLTNFAQRAENQFVKTNLGFGIAFLVIAVVIFVILIVTRRRSSPLRSENKSRPAGPANTSQVSTSGPEPKPTAATKPKRPRLIQ